jgi:hypothetical protein
VDRAYGPELYRRSFEGGGIGMGTVFGLLFTGIGLFMLVRGLVELRAGKASRNWPSVAGQVVLATVDVSVSTDDDGGTSRSYAPRVVYTYSASGQQYTSDQVVVGAKWHYPSRARAEAKLAYQSGQQVIVCYNPDNPTQAVLEPGATRGAWGTLIIGLIFAIAGGVVLANAVQ